jgi:hypothetical protein
VLIEKPAKRARVTRNSNPLEYLAEHAIRRHTGEVSESITATPRLANRRLDYKITAMRTPLFHVDAFTNRAFRGNPAAVVPLQAWLDDGLLLKVAAENNLSETAFFVPRDDLPGGDLMGWRPLRSSLVYATL